MATNASRRDSIARAVSFLKGSKSGDEFIILKLLPEPRGCCCFHCWPSTWADINRYTSPQGPIPDEGDVLIRTEGGDYVLECHESGPEIVVYLGIITASLVLTKSVVDLVTTFLKTLQKERHKPLSSVKPSRRHVSDGEIEEEILMEISFPLSADTEKMLDERIQEALQKSAKYRGAGDAGDNVSKS